MSDAGVSQRWPSLAPTDTAAAMYVCTTLPPCKINDSRTLELSLDSCTKTTACCSYVAMVVITTSFFSRSLTVWNEDRFILAHWKAEAVILDWFLFLSTGIVLDTTKQRQETPRHHLGHALSGSCRLVGCLRGAFSCDHSSGTSTELNLRPMCRYVKRFIEIGDSMCRCHSEVTSTRRNVS